MSIVINSIQFHRAGSRSTFPLALSYGTQSVILPEWTPDRTNPALGPVSFLASPEERCITVSFSRTNPGFTAIEVQALDADYANVCGYVEPQQVNFGSESDFVTLALRLTGGVRDRIAAHHDTLLWQWKNAGDSNWTDIRKTHHSCYTVLASPGPPWGDDQPLWVEVLEAIGPWVDGCGTSEKMQDAVTSRLYSLGEPPHAVLHHFGVAQYVNQTTFDCEHLLQTLGSRDFGQNIECQDTASAVSTFANAFGGRLFVNQIERASTKPVRQIGDTVFAPRPGASTKWHASITAN